VQEKDPPPALPILTLVALGAIGLLTRLNHFRALGVGALDRYRDHRLPPRSTVVYAEHTEKLPICNITPGWQLRGGVRFGYKSSTSYA
jgi:hypothetical protein